MKTRLGRLINYNSLQRVFNLRMFNSVKAMPHKSQLLISFSENSTSIPKLDSLIKMYWKESKTNSPNNCYRESTTLLPTVCKQSFANIISKNYKFSKYCRNLLRWEVIKNCENISLINTVFGYIKESRTRPTQFQDTNSVLEWCISDCIKHNDIMELTDFYISYYKNFPDKDISSSMLEKIMSALAYTNPKLDRIILQKFIDFNEFLTQRNVKFNIPEDQAVLFSNKATSLQTYPIVAKKVLTTVLHNGTNDSNRNKQIRAAYKIIDFDYTTNNPAGMHLAWIKIQESYKSIASHDSRILYKIIKMYSKQKAYRTQAKNIISKLPQEYYVNNALLLPAVINFATTTENFEMAEKVMNDITTFSNEKTQSVILNSRYTLSCLLRMHLRFNDTIGVDKVLQQINNIHGELSSADYQAIIAHLIKNNTPTNMLRAIRMIHKIPSNKTLPSIATVISGILNKHDVMNNTVSQEANTNVENLLDMANNQDPQHKDSIWSIIASIYIRNLTQQKRIQHTQPVSKSNYLKTTTNDNNSSLDIAKDCYTKSLTVPSLHITPNPFNSIPSNVKLKIDKSNKLVILRNIAKDAISSKRKDIFKWCCIEMFKNGMPIQELLFDWNLMMKHQIRRNHYKSLKDIKKSLKVNGLSFISSSLN